MRRLGKSSGVYQSCSYVHNEVGFHNHLQDCTECFASHVFCSAVHVHRLSSIQHITSVTDSEQLIS